MLRPVDKATLERLGLTYEAEDEGGHTCVVIIDYQLPAGLIPQTSDILLRIPGGFPDAQPDMFWLAEKVTTERNSVPPATGNIETHLRRQWVRWSRHITTWRPNIDDLATYLFFVRHCLEFEAKVVA